MQTQVLQPDDDLNTVVAEINQAVWDDANEMSTYSADALLAYLHRADTLFVVCHQDQAGTPVFCGMASARIEMKPYDNELWLYVDEVDVPADRRQQGAGSAIMRKLFELAEQAGCEEVWLGTETDNHAANALYRSLDPDETEPVVGYTWELD